MSISLHFLIMTPYNNDFAGWFLKPGDLLSNKSDLPPSLRDELYYRVPVDLNKEGIPLKNILLIGACFSNALTLRFRKRVFLHAIHSQIDHLPTHHIAPLPAFPPRSIEEYSFQIIQMPLRTIMPESSYWHLDYHDIEGHKKAFAESVERLELFLEYLLRYNTEHHLTTFVTNFLPPQQNPMGRFLPAYDLRNVVYYVHQLNQRLSELVDGRMNVHIVDANEIAASLGRRYIQDDILHTTNHGALAQDGDFPFDQNRFQPPKKYSEEHHLKMREFLDALWHEIAAQYKTVLQRDPVKIVICDLDDTLWRGIYAEEGKHKNGLEGWPLGIIEALLFLKKRGILLAISSNNEEELILNNWEALFEGHLKPDDFVVKKINRKDKRDHIEEILKEVHLLPQNALFVDDNPVEREKVQQAFPEIRTLGGDLYEIKRILLWAPETQPLSISQESSKRTELIQAQQQRLQSCTTATRAAFLESLQIHLEITKIDDVNHPDFPRAFELLNKTNQFNTTGARWTIEECDAFFKKTGFFYVFKARDKFTFYGLVGVVITQQSHLLQFVMSCRVLGLEIEKLVLTRLLHYFNGPIITADLIETPSNFICRELYAQSGFTKKGTLWSFKPST